MHARRALGRGAVATGRADAAAGARCGIPIVDVVTSSKRSAVKRMSRQLFPTAESPTSSTWRPRGAFWGERHLHGVVLGREQPLTGLAPAPHLEEVIIGVGHGAGSGPAAPRSLNDHAAGNKGRDAGLRGNQQVVTYAMEAQSGQRRAGGLGWNSKAPKRRRGVFRPHPASSRGSNDIFVVEIQSNARSGAKTRFSPRLTVF
jgi:hypothetical protein